MDIEGEDHVADAYRDAFMSSRPWDAGVPEKKPPPELQTQLERAFETSLHPQAACGFVAQEG
jgi:hypothetical protein